MSIMPGRPKLQINWEDGVCLPPHTGLENCLEKN